MEEARCCCVRLLLALVGVAFPNVLVALEKAHTRRYRNGEGALLDRRRRRPMTRKWLRLMRERSVGRKGVNSLGVRIREMQAHLLQPTRPTVAKGPRRLPTRCRAGSFAVKALGIKTEIACGEHGYRVTKS